MARKIGFAALSKAVYTRLTTDPLTSGYSIYNYVPDGTAFPYIEISDPVGRRKGARDHMGEENSLTIHVWTGAAGDKQTSEIMDAVTQALTASALTITGYTDLSCFMDYAEVFRDTSEPTVDAYHGVLRFLFWMEPTT